MISLTLAFAAAAATLIWMMGAPKYILPLVLLCSLAVPQWMVRRLQARWRRRMALQLPDALALWAGLLQAGQGTTQALNQLALRQSSPLGDELRLVAGQLRLGVALETAFAGLRERADLQDLRLLSTLLSTHRDLGGNLAESLQRLSGLLRSRLQMEDRIQSLTAQGRLQGVVVGVLPLLLLFVLYAMEPDAMRVLHTTWQGWAALAFIVALEIGGFLLIRRIVRIEV
jgi:tight adherence protein B